MKLGAASRHLVGGKGWSLRAMAKSAGMLSLRCFFTVEQQVVRRDFL